MYSRTETDNAQVCIIINTKQDRNQINKQILLNLKPFNITLKNGIFPLERLENHEDARKYPQENFLTQGLV